MVNFLFILSRDDNEAATRCFQFAKVAHEKGHKVDLFLIDEGVRWADKKKNPNIKVTTGDCPNDYLPYLIEKNVYVGVCTPCAKNRQLNEADFLPNASFATSADLINLASEAKVFNF